MQQILVRRPGSFRRLEVVEAPALALEPGQARVRTASIGVNFADCVVRLGLYPSAKEYVGWPIVPGFEFSGTIEELAPGDNPRNLSVGDEVFGVVRFGAYAEEVNVPTSQLFPLPAGVSLQVAGVIPVASLTAYYALLHLGAAARGKKVLIHSAAGGVGSIMVQMAKALGCFVVGVVGASAKVKFVQDLGADRVIDKSRERLFPKAREYCPEGFDVVLDANGVETLRGSYRSLRPTGRLVLYGAHTMLSRGSGRPNWLKLAWDFIRTPRFFPLDLINQNKNVLGFNLSYLFDEQGLLDEAMTRICAWYADGTLRVPALQEYPLSEAARAHEALQSGTTMGKLTLAPTRT